MRRTAYAIVTAHWVLAVLWYSRLSDRIPIHFNIQGEPDRWTNETFVAWFALPLVSLLLLLALVGSSRLARKVPHLWNVPEKKKFLALSETQREPIVERLFAVMDAAAVYTGLLLLYIQVAIYMNAVSGTSRLGVLFHVLTWGGMILLLVYSLRLYKEIKVMILRASGEPLPGGTS